MLQDAIVTDADDIAAFLQHPLATSLLGSIEDGVLVIDAGDRRVLAMNDKARELLGYDEDEAVGCQCKDMMNSPACTLSCPLTALMEGRDAGSELDLYYRGRDGRATLHAHTRMILVRDRSGRPVAGIEIFSDLRRVRSLEKQLRERTSLRGVVGRSGAMRAVFDSVEQLAPYDIPVVISGESGVGKELVAAALHAFSARADRAYLQLNCATLSPELTASELFGHKKGAFTGASSDRRGIFEEADGGTLLLDEIGELSTEVQAKLLRVLQEGEIQRLGEDRALRVDVRVLAATNKKLEEEVAGGRFREDLYYRLLGAEITVPPLRERKEDIPLLVEHFLSRIEAELDRAPLSLSRDALALLVKQDWPGNARELQNAIRLAAVRAQGPVIRGEHFGLAASRRRGRARARTLAEIEARAIEDALDEARGNMAEAARRLGIDRSTLWRKVKRRDAS